MALTKARRPPVSARICIPKANGLSSAGQNAYARQYHKTFSSRMRLYDLREANAQELRAAH
jgi:hypothetical protein